VRYLMLIYRPSDALPDPSMLARHQAFAEQTGRRGKLVDGAELTDVSATTTVHLRDGETIITDGPHAETKEHLGGYYVVDCDDLDEALEVARSIPLVDGESVEVRPIVDR
jgi:hypothetical protein